MEHRHNTQSQKHKESLQYKVSKTMIFTLNVQLCSHYITAN